MLFLFSNKNRKVVDVTWIGQPTLPQIYVDVTWIGQPTSGVQRRAIIMKLGNLYEITNAEVGTGLKPIVLKTGGVWAQRLTTEGSPLIIVNGAVRTLNSATETLLI